MITLNQVAPNFTLPDSAGHIFTLHEYNNRQNVVLIFYPGDDTAGCTKQLCEAKDASKFFEQQNAVVLAINHQGAESHQAFIKKYGLNMPLLIDQDRKVIEQYGAKTEENGDASTVRTVVIIDKIGLVKYIYRGDPGTEEIIKQLKEINNFQKN
ncbi:MAG: bacterioferritin comigratory protein [Candidatus Doudnabacteria bacterium]|nr:bacterioferritin comigratory protein [Candidatus Doudnabacteria bacterium]